MCDSYSQQHAVHQAVILAGGRGTRLGALTRHMPKPLLPFGGRPFLQLLLEELRAAGIREIVISAGYLADMVQRALGDGRQWGVRLHHAVEDTPLGTGGALRHAASLLPDTGQPFWVCNGDTLLDVPWQVLAQQVLSTGAWAGMVTRQVPDTTQYGAVYLDDQGRVTSFAEKKAEGPGLVNAGVYLFTTSALDCLPRGAGSLEQETLPLLAKQGHLTGVESRGFFLDIGTPAAYAEGQRVLPQRAWQKQRSAVLLDRDGTLIVEKAYLHDPEGVELLPTVAEGLRLLQSEGFALILLTNQAGIGHGYYGFQDMDAVHERLCSLLARHGVTLEALYHCPHHPQKGCACRKPQPGMAYAAASELGFSLDRAYMIGNNTCDVQLGLHAGIRTVLVRTGHGSTLDDSVGAQAQYVAENFLEAARWVHQTWRNDGRLA